MIRIAVIGCGYWGPNLIRNFNILENAQITHICDKDVNRLNSLKRTYPFLKTETDFIEIAKNNSIDAVAIATPINTHYYLAKQLILSGKHVLIEKPLTSSSEQAKELINLAQKKNKTLMVDHTFIYTPAVQKIKQMIDNNELGKLYYIDSVRVNLGLFQQDINALWDLGPHDFSIINFLLNRKPEYISAFGSSHIKKDLENIVYIILQYSNNLIAHIHVNWLSPVKIRRTLISGSKKMVVYNEMEPTEKLKIYDNKIKYKKNVKNLDFSFFQYRLGNIYSPRLDDIEALKIVTKHFCNCIINNKIPDTDGVAGLNVISMLEAAQNSLSNGGRPVKIQ